MDRDFRFDFASPPDADALIARQAEMFANRVRKNFDKLRKPFARQQIECFRLYDRDIPEIRAVADWYAGHLVVGEYTRTQTEMLPEWLEHLTEAAGKALGIPGENLHCKRRRTRPGEGERYQRLGRSDRRLHVRERDLQLWVNLDDFLDTGLFSDHRETRRWVQAEAAGKDVLNLFCYTGAFTVAAALGGARTTTSVDASGTYLQWLADNLALSGVQGHAHSLERGDVRQFLEVAARQGWQWDVIVCDPPSFSDRGAWDVQRDHRALVEQCLAVLRPGGTLWFSCNHQRFQPELDGLAAADCTEWTARSVPVDFRNRQVHRLWKITQLASEDA